MIIDIYKTVLKTYSGNKEDKFYLQHYLDYLCAIFWKTFHEEKKLNSESKKREQAVIAETTITSTIKAKEKKITSLPNEHVLAKNLWADLSSKQKLEVVGLTWDNTVNAVRVKESGKRKQTILDMLQGNFKITILNNDVTGKMHESHAEVLENFISEAMIWDVDDVQRQFIFSHYFSFPVLVEFCSKRNMIGNIGQFYESPELTALFDGDTTIYKLLKENKINDSVFQHILAMNEDGDPLHKAAKNGHYNVVELLLEKGVFVGILDRNGQTPLHRAASNGHLNIAELLIAKNADVNIVSKTGTTPLHLACEVGNVDIVKLLLSHGPKIDVVAQSGITPLELSIDNGNIDIVEMLLAHGAGESSDTSLNRACKGGQIKVVELLLEKSACVDVIDKFGGTPLYWACFYGHKQVAELLLEKQANINVVGQKGSTVLHVTSDKGHLSIVDLLLSKGMDVNGLNNRSGNTPLHKASHSGHVEVAELLITKKADIDAISDNGSTPLHSASRQGYVDVAQLLIKKRANINITDKLNQTPRNTATANGHNDLAKLFDE